MALLFRGPMVFTGSGDAPRRLDVAVRGGVVAEIGERLEPHAGDEVVEARERTLIPGLIDCHTHVAYGGTDGGGISTDEPAARATANLRRYLAIGITTVRDAGGLVPIARDAALAELRCEPRVLTSLLQLSPPDGPYGGMEEDDLAELRSHGIPNPVASGAEGLRAKVGQYVDAGAEVIKIFATGHFAMENDGARRSMFSPAELSAIVAEAARRGVRVMAHAHGAEGARAAAEAGVTSIEHGFYLDAPALEAMREHEVVFVPTLLASAALSEESAKLSAEQLDSVRRQHRAAVSAAHRAGVRIAMGTDCPMAPHGSNLEELRLLQACGLSAADALRAATSVAADLLGTEDGGRIEVGARADLVLVRGDALDFGSLEERVERVYLNGSEVPPPAGR